METINPKQVDAKLWDKHRAIEQHKQMSNYQSKHMYV